MRFSSWSSKPMPISSVFFLRTLSCEFGSLASLILVGSQTRTHIHKFLCLLLFQTSSSLVHIFSIMGFFSQMFCQKFYNFLEFHCFCFCKSFRTHILFQLRLSNFNLILLRKEIHWSKNTRTSKFSHDF